MKKTELSRTELNAIKARALDKFYNDIIDAITIFSDDGKDVRFIKTRGALLNMLDILEVNNLIDVEIWSKIAKFTRF